MLAASLHDEVRLLISLDRREGVKRFFSGVVLVQQAPPPNPHIPWVCLHRLGYHFFLPGPAPIPCPGPMQRARGKAQPGSSCVSAISSGSGSSVVHQLHREPLGSSGSRETHTSAIVSPATWENAIPV